MAMPILPPFEELWGLSFDEEVKGLIEDKFFIGENKFSILWRLIKAWAKAWVSEVVTG